MGDQSREMTPQEAALANKRYHQIKTAVRKDNRYSIGDRRNYPSEEVKDIYITLHADASFSYQCHATLDRPGSSKDCKYAISAKGTWSVEGENLHLVGQSYDTLLRTEQGFAADFVTKLLRKPYWEVRALPNTTAEEEPEETVEECAARMDREKAAAAAGHRPNSSHVENLKKYCREKGYTKDRELMAL